MLVKEINRYASKSMLAHSRSAEKFRLAPHLPNALNSKFIFRYSIVNTSEIQFAEGASEGERPAIKAATLQKLVDRATYEKYPCKVI